MIEDPSLPSMIGDSVPHRVFKVGELTRLIASQLVLINRRSAVNLACACRYLEEPVLSILWEKQKSLRTLLVVLPVETWGIEDTRWNAGYTFRIVGDPPPEAWDRVWRYASWMRALRVNEMSTLEGDTLYKLRLNSPPGWWFPALQKLSWTITRSNLPFVADLCFSPHLKMVSISVARRRDDHEDVLAAINSTISALPTTNLQLLLISPNRNKIPWARFEDSFSSVVLRCGQSLTKFISPIPLSDAAINHLIQLPCLRTLHIECPPPGPSALTLPTIFPPLTHFMSGRDAIRGWLSLFKRLGHGVPATQGVTPLFKMNESLRVLETDAATIDVSLLSPIKVFRNLVSLCVASPCDYEGIEAKCTFKLNDDNVTELAMALSQLDTLHLGHTCPKNTCATTVACLLPISVHCVKMETLEILFNTTNIVEDFKNISADPQFQEMRSLPKCRLSYLDVWLIPLTLNGPEFETVGCGLIDIFPSLERCQGIDGNWGRVSGRIRELRERRGSYS